MEEGDSYRPRVCELCMIMSCDMDKQCWSRADIMPQAFPRLMTAAQNIFKDHRLASEIAISLFGALHPYSHDAWETFQDVAHPEILLQQARLIWSSKSGLFEKEGEPLDIGNHFKLL